MLPVKSYIKMEGTKEKEEERKNEKHFRFVSQHIITY